MYGRLGLLAALTIGDEKTTYLTYYRFRSDGSHVCLHKYEFDKTKLNNVKLEDSAGQYVPQSAPKNQIFSKPAPGVKRSLYVYNTYSFVQADEAVCFAGSRLLLMTTISSSNRIYAVFNAMHLYSDSNYRISA